MHTLSRRQFLVAGTGLLTTTLWPRFAFPSNKTPYLLSACVSKHSHQNGASLLNLADQAVSHIHVDIPAHIYEQCPYRSELAVGAIKWGGRAAAIDLREKKVVADLHAPPDAEFFGHLAFFDQGRHVVFTANTREEGGGRLLVFNTHNWNCEHIVSTGGQKPHECLIAPNGDLMVVNLTAHENQNTSVIDFFDVADMKLKKSVPISASLGHALFLNSTKAVFSGGSPDDETAIVVYDFATGKEQNFRQAKGAPAKPENGEALSLMKIGEDQIAVTLPDSKELLFWDLKTNQVHEIMTPQAILGLAKVGADCYANSSQHGLIKFSAGRTPAGIEKNFVQDDFANGRHMRLVML